MNEEAPNLGLQPMDDIQKEIFLGAFRSLPLNVLLEEQHRVAQRVYDLRAKSKILSQVVEEKYII